MATVAGYGISVWVAVQSLAQLETSYGLARAATIRDSADAHVYYRQRDVETAQALSRRTGPTLVQGHNTGQSKGTGVTATASWSEGYTEREQPLLLPHEVLQLDAEQVVAFAGGTPPARLERVDWAQRSQAAPARPPATAGRADHPRDAAGRVGAGAGTSHTHKHTEPGRLMRPALLALLVAVIIAGALLNAQRDQQNAQSRQVEQRQTALAIETAAAATSVAIEATNTVRQRADSAHVEATVGAQATQAAATMAAYRANLDATVTASQASARATNTALAQR